MATEGAEFKDGYISLFENRVMPRKKCRSPWSGEFEIHLQHKEKRMLSSSEYDQLFAATYPPSLDVALLTNASTQSSCTLFHLQS